MTTVTIIKSSDDNFKRIEVEGHAGFAEYNKDIVCAAISSMTINLVNSIEKFTDDRFSGSADPDKGIITLEFSEVPSRDADLLCKSFELGVTSISKQYGKKFLNIKFRRE
jgi:uncharacterized protein YsxB (DUF464 family)